MDKTAMERFDGTKVADIIIPVHNIEVTNGMLSAYLKSGETIAFSLDKMQDCDMTIMPYVEPSPEVIERIKKMSRTMIEKQDFHRKFNVGASDYSKHRIQPWDIWREYHLDPWSADIVKRILRTKQEEGLTVEQSRRQDLEKIKHICDELISQIDDGYKF